MSIENEKKTTIETKKEIGKRKRTKYPKLRPLWAGVFLDILGFFLIIPFLATFMVLYHTTPLMIGLLMATNALFTFISTPFWGKMSDRLGRKPMLIICQCGTTTAFLILAFSNSLEVLFLSRIVDGIFGGNFALAKAIVSDNVPPKDRGFQMANVGVVAVLASLIGPGIGGALSVFGILGPGLFAAGASVITIMITVILLEESWPKSKRAQKVKVRKKKKRKKKKLRKNKNAMYLLTLYALHTLTFMMFLIAMALVMAIVLGLNAFEIGVLLTIAGIFRAIVRFTLFKPTLRLLGEKNTMRFGLFLFVITFFFVGFMKDVILFTICLLIFSYAASCTRGPLISKITQSVSPREMGKINGVTSSLDSMGRIIGPLVGGFMLSVYDPFWLGLLMSIIALIAFIMIFKEIKPYSLKFF